MTRKLPSLSLGLALAGLLGAGAVSAQTPANDPGQVQNPHSPDNAKRTGSDGPAADGTTAARPAQAANPHSTDNKDRAAEGGAGASATGAAQAENPHSVKNKDHHGKRHHKAGDARPTAAPATPDAK